MVEEILRISYKIQQQGQNLCFYGFGDKNKVIQDFYLPKLSQDNAVIEISCTNKELNSRNLMLKIFIQMEKSFQNFSSVVGQRVKNTNSNEQIKESIMKFLDS